MKYLQAIFLIVMCVAACSQSERSKTSAENVVDRPNIVFILVDDLGWRDVGFNGSEILTPNIDSLADHGMVLQQSRVFPICSPTRAALLTGRNPIQFGVDGPMENDAMLPAELTLLPEHLQASGYDTWMVGKWHLGLARKEAAPPARGFDHFYGNLGGFVDYYTHVYFGGLDWQRNGKSIREEGYATDLQTAEAIRLVDGHSSESPFFMYLSYIAPHTPLQYPPNVTNDYAGITDPDRQVFAQMTTHLDESIGMVVQALKSNDLYENTVIVFMSDNGGNLEAGASNGELRAGKGSVLEGGVRVPTVISWPARIEANQVSDVPVFAQDWLPTILEIAGVQYVADISEGTSFWRALERAEELHRESPIVVGVAKSKAVFDWPWKLVQNDAAEGAPPSLQLFNVTEDPFETTDLSSELPDKVELLAKQLQSLPNIPSKGARGPKPETLFRDESGSFIYDIRKPETREPWAESAIEN